MKSCPCGAIPTTSSDITYSVVWCASCHATLTGEFTTPEDAILVWNHGAEVLPPNCPFCHWMPDVLGADTATPQISCTMPQCPIRGRVFTLEEWNQARPQPSRLNELVERWEAKKDPKLRSSIVALKKAIEQHVRNRFRGTG